MSRHLDKTQARLASLSASALSELARAATGCAGLEVQSWDYEPVHGGFGSAVGGTGLYRLRLRASARQPLSFIIKVLYERRGEDERSPYYWKREFEVYRSGMLDDMPANTFSTPKIYRADDYGDSCWIWMEAITDGKGAWSIADFHDIAMRLGRFNGAWLTGKSPPTQAWLSHNWHSAIIPGLADRLDNLEPLLETPLARTALPMDARNDIEAIWHERRLFQDALAQLPQTLCHTDAFRRNILHRKDEVILLDWALASIGAIGEELVCLVAVSLFYEGFTAAHADELDKTVFAGYIAGLRQAGWRGEPELARIGFTCAMVLRGLAGVKQDLEMLRDAGGHRQMLRTHGMTSLDEVARLFADVRRFRLLKMAREARALLTG